MADGKRKDEWSRWSLAIATFINANRDPKKGRACKPEDIDPYRRREQRPGRKPTPEEQVSLFSMAIGAKRSDEL